MAMIIIVACAVFGPLAGYAAQLTSSNHDAATAVVNNWMQYSRDMNWSHSSRLDAAPALQELFYNGQLVGYVAQQGEGYVIVPAYEELPPITAYSTDSRFDPNDEGGMVQMLKEELANKIQAVQTVLDANQPTPEMQPVREQIEKDRQDWHTYSASYQEFNSAMQAAHPRSQLDATQDVGPLCSTVWHQGAPFNNFCPMGSGGRTVVGCVATAMSQILAFWHSPANGTGSHSYQWAGDNSCGTATPGATLSATFSDSYDWANALNVVSSSAPQVQQDAVAEISYETGVAVNMMYGHCGSGAYVPGPVTSAFQNYFGMAGGITVINRSSYSSATAWWTALQTELTAGRPMFYTIRSHAIVCDGARSGNQLHFNYGWAEGHTTWYTADNLYCPWAGCSPTVEQAICGIRPNNTPPPPSASVTVSSPNGAESWATGTSHSITWTSSNLNENVKVELNRAYPTGAWEILTAGTANTGSYSWAVSGAASSAARVRISGISQTSVTDVSDANFSITGGGSTTPSLSVTSPNGGESWAIGSQHAITWSSANFSQNVQIEFNRSYPSGTWEVISSSAANSGSYTWTLAGSTSSLARIRVRGTTSPTVGDTSNANFTLAPSGGGSGTITISTPNGGETARLNVFYPIRWSSSGLSSSSTVRIQINRNYPTGLWENLNYSAVNSGSYSWPVYGATTTHARIRILSNTNYAIGDTSNANFTVSSSYFADGPLPTETKLEAAYPNPFNPTTQIRFQLAEATHVRLEVFDITGRQVATLMDGAQEAGTHAVTIDGTNLSTGIYFVRMSAGTVQNVQKIQLLK
jgi:hypothetical protein